MQRIVSLIASLITRTATLTLTSTNVDGAINELDGKAVHNTGDENIAGNKLFSNNIGIGISPLSDMHIDRGTATASQIRFAAGATTGTNDFEVGIASNGTAVLRQKGARSIDLFTGNIQRLRINGTGIVQVLGTTASTSSTTGAFTVAGGLGVAGNINSNANIIARSVLGFANNSATFLRNTSSGSGSGTMTCTVWNGTVDRQVWQAHESGGFSVGSVASDPGLDNLYIKGNSLASRYNLAALNAAPASATDTGTTGEMRWDGNYHYICTATNTWKRSMIYTTF